MTLIVTDTQHNNALHYVERRYAVCRFFIYYYDECHYAECRHAECLGAHHEGLNRGKQGLTGENRGRVFKDLCACLSMPRNYTFNKNGVA
jgi:hypothetical protein